jgi:hypothetical protein
MIKRGNNMDILIDEYMKMGHTYEESVELLEAELKEVSKTMFDKNKSNGVKMKSYKPKKTKEKHNERRN